MLRALPGGDAMTTMTSVVPAVIDWLVAAAQASRRLGQAVPPVAVFDGVQPPGGSQEAPRALWIAGDPASPSDPAAEAEQVFASGTRARNFDESGAIAMTAQHWTGSTDNKVHRDGAAAIVGGVELLVRGLQPEGPGDATMGGLVFQSWVTGPFDWRPRQVSGGALCLVTFHVTYMTRLTT